jgi:hypothetical protein
LQTSWWTGLKQAKVWECPKLEMSYTLNGHEEVSTLPVFYQQRENASASGAVDWFLGADLLRVTPTAAAFKHLVERFVGAVPSVLSLK